MSDRQELLRNLPAINEIIQRADMQSLVEKYNHSLVVEAAAEVVQEIREGILERGEAPFLLKGPDALDRLSELIFRKVSEKLEPRLRRVINATGIVLHTNLGRAVLSKTAIQALTNVGAGYSNLELDLSTGERGSRYAHVENLICRLTGAEGAMVVNNNAAAVLLVLNTMAQGREVVVSRGQLVEIGGSFRIPDVMTQSGATLIEVGTTNKTHPRDYMNAINETTALLLKVHTSNYKIIGFTSEVSIDELVRIGYEKGVPVFEDLGSGVLIDFNKYGLSKEPSVQESIRRGVDLVSFSGDKLFGGPQAGIIVGRKELIERCKKNPLTRALRVDKFAFAALEATLKLYLDEGEAVEKIPTLRMLTMSYDELLQRVRKNVRSLKLALGNNAGIEVIDGFSQVGGGALPQENIPSPLMAIEPLSLSVNRLEEKLREAEVPVLGRIQKDRVIIDYRTILPEEDKVLNGILIEILKDSALEQGVSN